MSKVEMLYHEPTDTHWVNDLNWKERHQTESIFYGHIEWGTNGFEEIKSYMSQVGFYIVKNDDVPWGNLGKIKPEMTKEGYEHNIFIFE